MDGMKMSAEERAMWEAIDETLPKLRKLTAETRSRGEAFTADALLEIGDRLAFSRPSHVAGVIRRAGGVA